MASNWDVLARSLGHPGEKEMWEELYTKKGLSITQIANQLASAPHTIRRRLNQQGVKVRTRGGAQSNSFDITPEVMENIAKYGIPKVARSLKVSSQAIYSRLYYRNGLRKRDLVKELQGPAEPIEPDVVEEPPAEESK